MSTSTMQKPATASKPTEKPENGVPVAARQAPAPVPPPVDDEELRKEAAAVEQEEEALASTNGQTTTTEVEDAVSNRLFGAAKEITDEIEKCDKVIAQAEADYKAKQEALDNEHANVVEKAEARRAELKSQFQNAINKMQSQFGVTPKVRKVTPTGKPSPKARQSNGRDKPIRVLILEYLEKHRSARTSEIRHYLQSQGRTTNPGVELSRMVKDKSIINKERGMYVLGKSK